jgi:sRNA-binding protein
MLKMPLALGSTNAVSAMLRLRKVVPHCLPVPRLLSGAFLDVLAALGEAVRARDLQSALRAYTSNAGYLRVLLAGACRVDLDGNPAGTVTPEDETAAKARLAEFKNGASPREQVPPPEAPAMRPAEENQKPSAPSTPKRLSLADLREAGRRRREAAA